MNTDSNLPPSFPKIRQTSTEWLIGGGETGELIRSMDWSATPLGPRDEWPQYLRTVVSLILNSGFPMAILWGSELIAIYNDAYKLVIADRHPKTMGRPTREVWPEVGEINEPIFKRVMTGGETIYWEDVLFLVTRNDCMENAYFTLAYSPIRIEDNQIGGALGVLLETTQRVLLEQNLKQANEIFKVKISEQKRVETELRDSEYRYHELFESAAATNKELAFQNEEKEKRASELIIANKELAFQNEEKEKRASELIIANAEASRSNKDLEQFAYVASHDLQEPLRMVSSYTQLLARHYEGRLDEKAKKFMDYVMDGAGRMHSLINDLLTYSRIETQSMPLATTDTHGLLCEAIRNLAAMIEEKRAIITNDDLPTVRSYPSQLLQVFQNLISNAIKFQGENVPHIHVSAQDKGREWVFSIRDNGIGIEKQYVDRIFVIFQRLHDRQEYPGSGIGLAICKRIVERHGGRIWFESEPGKGTTFFFTIAR